MRGVPEDVQKKADDLYWDRDKSHGGFGCAEEAYEYVAEWARKEALREAEAAIGHITRGYMVRGIQTIRLDDAANAIRALAEGGD